MYIFVHGDSFHVWIWFPFEGDAYCLFLLLSCSLILFFPDQEQDISVEI